MSYILDALRKSEHERQRGAVPDLLTLQGATAKRAGKNRSLSFLFLVVVLLNACVVIWWLSPWRVTRPETIGGRDKVVGPKTVAPLPPINTDRGLEVGLAPEPRAGLRKGSLGAPAVFSKREAGSDSSVSVPPTTGKLPPSNSEQSSSSRPEGGKKLLSLKDLPLSVQQSLPELSISVHFYASNPASRMVSINNRTLQEGEELTAGLKLEEITRDGAIFSYQTYRFLVGLKQSLPAE